MGAGAPPLGLLSSVPPAALSSDIVTPERHMQGFSLCGAEWMRPYLGLRVKMPEQCVCQSTSLAELWEMKSVMRDTSALTGAWHPMLGPSFIFTLSYPIYHLLLSEAQRGIMKKEV